MTCGKRRCAAVVQNRSQSRFRRPSRVLYRCDWALPAARGAGEGAAREALVEEILRRREGALQMPAWQGEPRVQAHIADLDAWLSARAQGTQLPGRPAP